MKISSEIKFIDEKIKKEFYELKDNNNTLYKALNKALNQIEKNAFVGIQISKKLIPKEYKKKYQIENLWKYNLPNGYRLLYSLISNETFVVGLVLDWLNHKNYEKVFKY